MTIHTSLRLAASTLVLFVCAGLAAAQGPVAGATTTSELAMTAEVVTAVQLNISTGAGGTTVTGDNATGLFAIDFGDVNGRGVGSPAAGLDVVVDAGGALYSTPIVLTPIYSGFDTETADVQVEAGTAGDEALVREGTIAISPANTISATPRDSFLNAASGSANTRYIGLYIPNGEAAGAKVATVIFTITVQ